MVAIGALFHRFQCECECMWVCVCVSAPQWLSNPIRPAICWKRSRKMSVSWTDTFIIVSQHSGNNWKLIHKNHQICWFRFIYGILSLSPSLHHAHILALVGWRTTKRIRSLINVIKAHIESILECVYSQIEPDYIIEIEHFHRKNMCYVCRLMTHKQNQMNERIGQTYTFKHTYGQTYIVHSSWSYWIKYNWINFNRLKAYHGQL